MQKSLVRKGLVLGIILLFVGSGASIVVSKDFSYINSDSTFLNMSMNNNPPEAPSIDGPNSGKPGEEYIENFE